jgi:hypothetical protein
MFIYLFVNENIMTNAKLPLTIDELREAKRSLKSVEYNRLKFKWEKWRDKQRVLDRAKVRREFINEYYREKRKEKCLTIS